MNDADRTGPYQPAAAEVLAKQPQRIGRYRIERVLGEGGFGIVYLAHDEQLQRLVAVKVPHCDLVAHPEDAKAFLTEARTVANLDHPNIVPVHDVGSTEDYPCFIVSKFIEGRTLAEKIKDARLSIIETLELVATVAEALHYAHRQGLVHRDIKPGNIFLGASGKPFVADFGLALREEDFGKGPACAGTPAYMSPEQARGEGHRVDGRSDIFSPGVVFYEMLTGRRPFRGETRDELFEQIASIEPRPPRQMEDTIAKELERICLKALSKRATERYTTAKDMADDVRQFIAACTAEERQFLGASLAAGGTPSQKAASTPLPSPVPTAVSDAKSLKVVPKGLRSFDAHDADFFLELLPGPRDRDGLPDSVRFWKRRVEETDADETFAVGLIYGPSGCGKSSLVKAGLLPRLCESVLPVYVEATSGETETRLLNGLRKCCPALPAQLGLKETLAGLRRGRGLPAGGKVLIVLDQFEQWLHARQGEAAAELVDALRQCDGCRLQCITLVRDDFWMAATRFMRDLEFDLVPGRNTAAADLFDPRHAGRVLTAFGRAFGTLPEQAGALSHEHKAFVEQAVAGLAQDGKVICVRLALFAEMIKGKPWTPGTLKALGGAEGVGVAFLEETFASATANPKHRLHQRAARAVLEALLPESGTDLKGHLRSQADLLAASGYAGRPRDFAELMRILDGELRLITPTEPEGREEGGSGRDESEESATSSRRADPSCARYYQLTHDYLVPSLRDWLTRKQKETRRGRAELLLADRAGVWNARPENRQLPSLAQWASLRWLTQKRHWTPAQRKMMRRAARHHALRCLVAAVLLALAGWGSVVGYGMLKAHALRDRLLDADTADVPGIVADMAPYRRWLDPLLRAAQREAEASCDARKRLHTSLALLPVDSGQQQYLYARLLKAEPQQVAIIREALLGFRQELIGPLWALVEDPKADPKERLRASCALAKFDPSCPRWEKSSGQVVQDLVSVDPVFLGIWSDGFRPVKAFLIGPLADIFRAPGTRRGVAKTLATNLLADYAADQHHLLADLLLDADEAQLAVLYPKFQIHGEGGLPLLVDEVDRTLPPDAKNDRKERLAKRQANAAVVLLRMNHPEKVWPLLRPGPDPRLRSYLIHRFGPLGADAGVLVKRLLDEPDVAIRRALILSLGPEEFGEAAWAPDTRELLVHELKEMYRTAADPGLHAAAEWLLRQWHEEAWPRQTNDAWAKDKELRDKRIARLRSELASGAGSASQGRPAAKPQWYVNAQGQTMVVIPGPVDFLMGSPPEESGRFDIEHLHRRRIGRHFAVAAKPVTVEQYQHFRALRWTKRYAPSADCPAPNVNWHLAAAYCNWINEQEGIPPEEWCYEMTPQGQVTKLKENYLSRTGYRLPTEAEWEYACRAGTVTSRSYGETEELLPKYGWFVRNAGEHSWPVGSKKPNDLGFFDMHGNVYQLCLNTFHDYPQGHVGRAVNDEEESVNAFTLKLIESRGCCFNDLARYIRSARRIAVPAAQGWDHVGFRPARTFR
jgi:serine/threonine protein kinase/formylglycine-generating enzyme required for sulfatase activity